MKPAQTWWLLACLLLAAVAVFVGTVFPYLMSKDGGPVGYGPLTLGLVAFTSLAGGGTYILGPGGGVRWWHIGVAALVGGAVFFYLCMLVTVNLVGS